MTPFQCIPANDQGAGNLAPSPGGRVGPQATSHKLDSTPRICYKIVRKDNDENIKS